MGIRVNSRLPATLESLASTQHGATHAVKRGPVTSLKGRGEKFNRKRSCGACQQESNTANQPPFCGTQKRRRMASNNRPEKIKSVPQAAPFQNGGVTHATKCSAPELLHGQGGSERCLSNSSSVSRVPLSLRFSRRQRTVVTVSNPSIRTLHCSIRLFKDNKASSSILTSSRHPYYHLPGRHVVSVTNGELTSAGSVDSSMAFLLPRVSNKHTKDYSSPLLRDRVFGIHGEYQNHDRGPAYNQEEWNPVRGGQSPSEQNNLFEGALPASGQVSSHKASSVQGTITLSGTSTFENFHDESWTRGGYNSTGSRERLDLVAHTTANASLLPYCPEGSISSHRVRCFIERLGCQLQRSENEWGLECERSSMSYQPPGVEGGLSGNSVLLEGEIRSECVTSFRQPHSNSILEPHGGSIHDPAVLSSTRDMGVVLSTRYNDSCRISTWGRECSSRLGVTSPQRQQQLAVVPSSFRCSEPIAWSFLHRPICIQDQSSVANLLQLETGSWGDICRCLYNVMAGPVALFVPTFLSNWQSSPEDSEGIGESSLPDCSSLAWANVVFSAADNVGRLPHSPPSISRTTLESGSEASPVGTRGEVIPDRMACLRQCYEMQGFSERVAELLVQSWRDNTNSAYNSAWRKWHRWCAERNYNPTSTPLSNVLQFLAEQFDTGLQYRTVNTLRSAISTTHPNIDGMAVGRHPLVSRLLRGMFNLRPPSPHYSHSWDVRIVVRFLSNYKSADLSTLQLAKKTVTLMALVNADRCSDLAALDRDHIQWTASGVKFTVVRLTKTRRSGAPREVFYPMF